MEAAVAVPSLQPCLETEELDSRPRFLSRNRAYPSGHCTSLLPSPLCSCPGSKAAVCPAQRGMHFRETGF